MSDYSNSKSGPGGVFPDNAVETSWNRLEPLVSPEQVKSRHLFGIPLVSAMKDPLTGKAQVMTDDLIKDVIDRVATIDKVTITPSNNVDIYTVPIEWIETAYLPMGQINIIPLVSAIGYSTPAAVSSGGAVFLSVLGGQQWVPAFWQIEYTSGFPDGMMPKPVNELIGCIAAMEILAMLAATYAKSSSHSLGIDGMSQSVSTPGPALFDQRLVILADKRKTLTSKLKTMYGLKIFSGQV
jgi:hypothetical protein